jgi:hypothetical protein
MRTRAMAAGLTDRVWSLRDVLIGSVLESNDGQSHLI